MRRTLSTYRIAKKLAPSQRGALRLAEQYGDALVCVRHRHDPSGRHPIVTVELLVARVPIARRATPIVGVRIDYREAGLRTAVLAAGAKWDAAAKVWRMPRGVARSLGLLRRVVPD